MKKGISIKSKIVAFTVVPAVIITVVLVIMGITYMKTGMENEILKGLMSSAYTYKDIASHEVQRESGDSDIESSLKRDTGYDFTWFDGDTRKNSSLGESVIGTKAADTVIDAVINKGNTFSSTNTQVAGKAYFVAYVPVKDDSGKTVAMAFTGVSRESVTKQIQKSMITMIVIAVILFVVSMIVAIREATKMANAIGSINSSVGNLSEGKFVKDTKFEKRNDDIGVAIRDTNNLIDTLRNIVTNILMSASNVKKSSDELSDMTSQIAQTAEDVSNAVQEIASGATQQADEIQSASENIMKIDEAVTGVKRSSENLENLSSKMKEASEISTQSLSELQTSSSNMTDKINDIASAIQDTQNAVSNISEKIAGITNIATQTNLLSLNASIEAARAGEAGKGFSVVAEEIGKLASDSKQMADDIKAEMEILLQKAGNAVDAAGIVRDTNNNQQESLEETIKSINAMIDDINKTISEIAEIKVGAEQCEISKNAVSDIMNSLSAISEENAASSQETGASMEELSATVTTLAQSANDLKTIAEKLNDEMKFFKTEK